MPNVTATCPYCNAASELDAILAGQKVSCPKCGKLFEIPRPGESPELSFDFAKPVDGRADGAPTPEAQPPTPDPGGAAPSPFGFAPPSPRRSRTTRRVFEDDFSAPAGEPPAQASPAPPAPMKTVPATPAPMKTVPAQAKPAPPAPMKTVPAQAKPAPPAPMKTVPAKAQPAPPAPMETVPAQSPPGPPAPAKTVQAAPQPPSGEPSVNVAADGIADAWSVGDVIIDLYEVKQVFEGGGMGLVYRVHHRGWNAELAVKSPRPDFFRTLQDRDNFVREAETWIKLGLHPNTVSCFYVRTLGDIPRVFAEFVAGGSLQDWIEDGRLYAGGHEAALSRILDVAIQFAWGLQFAHEGGLVHQDVKPANVLMTSDGTAKVTDFGLARARAAAREGAEPAAGDKSIMVSAGGMTPAYCSPEQAGKQQLTRRTDIWSWAVSVLHMFAGEVTWGSGHIADAALEAFLAENTPTGERPAMPEALGEVLTWCMRQNADERPADFAQVVGALRDVYKECNGQEYSRAEPKPADAHSDSLNNQAASLVDIGKSEEAMGLWREALSAHAGHPEATYNSGLMAWRSGKIADDAFLKALISVGQSAKDPRVCEYLAGLIHIERRDAVAVAQAIADTASDTSDSAARDAFLAAVRARGVGASGVTRSSPAALCLETDEFLKTPPGSQRNLGCLALSTDGTRIGCGVSRSVFTWNVPGGDPSGLPDSHRSSVIAAAFAGPDQTLVTCDTEGRVVRWSPASSTAPTEWATKVRGASGMAVDPSGSGAVVYSSGGECEFVDFSATETRPLRGMKRAGILATAAPSGAETVILGCKGGAIERWDVTGDGAKVDTTFEGHARDVTALAVTSDGGTLVSGAGDGTIRMWDAASGEGLLTFTGHAGAVTGLALCELQQRLLSTGDDGTVRLWDAATGRCLRTFGSAESAGATVAPGDVSSQWTGRVGSKPRLPAMSADGHTLVWLDGVRVQLHVRTVPEGPPVNAPWVLCRPASAAEVILEEQSFAGLMDQANAAMKTGKTQDAYRLVREAMDVPGHERAEEGVNFLSKLTKSNCRYAQFEGAFEDDRLRADAVPADAVSIDGDGQVAVAGCSDGFVRGWDLTRGEQTDDVADQGGQITSVCVTADGKRCAIGSGSGALRTVDLATRRSSLAFDGHFRSISTIAFSRDPRRMASSDAGGAVAVWDTTTGKVVQWLKGCTEGVNPVTFAGDGSHLAAGTGGGKVMLFRIADGVPVARLQAGDSEITALASSPRGGYLLSGDSYGSVVLWELKSGQEQNRWQVTGAIRALGFTPEGSHAVVVRADGAVSVHAPQSGGAPSGGYSMKRAAKAAAVSRDARTVIAASAEGGVATARLDWKLEFGRGATAVVSGLQADVPWQGVGGVTSFSRGFMHKAKVLRLHIVALLCVLAIPAYFAYQAVDVFGGGYRLKRVLTAEFDEERALVLSGELGEEALSTLIEVLRDQSLPPRSRVAACRALASLGPVAKNQHVENALVRAGGSDGDMKVREEARTAERLIFVGSP